MAMGYDGSIKIDSSIDSKGFNTGIQKMIGSLRGLATAVGIAFGVAAAVNFGKSAVASASEMSSALTGLQSILDGTGKSFTDGKKFIDSYIKDGLIPATNAITAYKNLALRGYDTSQIEKVLIALKDSAAFGRQSSLSMGQAVQSATEGLKNENSILVDNAGVTKNVSMMWMDYAKSIGTTVASLTKQQKIQAEVAGIMQETRFQTGDAAKIAGTYAGQVAALGTSFYNLKVAIGNAIIPVLTAIIPYVKMVIDWLTVLFNTFARVISLFFNVNASVASTETSTGGVASNTEAAADAAGNLAGNTKKAEKAAKGALAAFDELNVLQQDTANASGGAGAGGAGGGPGAIDVGTAKDLIPDEWVSKINDFKEALINLFTPTMEALQRLWKALEPFKNFVWTALIDFYERFLKPVGSWVFGEGLPRFIDAITNGLSKIDWGKINQALRDLWDALAPFAIKIGEGLIWLWENVLVPLGTWTVSDLLPAFLDLLSAAIKVLNAAIDALKPLGQWLFDNFLAPLADWTGQAIIDALKWLTDRLNELSAWIKENPEAFRTMTIIIAEFFAAWKVSELAVAIAGMISSLMGITGALIGNTAAWIANTAAKIANTAETIAIAALLAGDFIKNIALSAIRLGEETAAWIASTAAKIAANAAQIALNIATGIWTGIATVAATVTTAFGAAVAFLTSPIGLVIIAIIALIAIIVLLITHWDWVKQKATEAWEWIKQKWGEASAWFQRNVTEPVKKWFDDAWTSVKNFASTAWTNIQLIWKGAKDWFSQNVTDPIKNAFKTALEWIGEKWSSVFNGFKDVARGAINGVIDLINGLLRALAGGINGIASVVNAVNFTVPSWVPGFGGKSFSMSFPTVSAPQIPRLATGAVIPPNSEFAAILGDQRSGRNIETPEALMRQIVREELAQMGGQEVTINFAGSLGALVRELKPYIDKENARIGSSLISVKGAA